MTMKKRHKRKQTRLRIADSGHETVGKAWR
jgi:hypothetical protein